MSKRRYACFVAEEEKSNAQSTLTNTKQYSSPTLRQCASQIFGQSVSNINEPNQINETVSHLRSQRFTAPDKAGLVTESQCFVFRWGRGYRRRLTGGREQWRGQTRWKRTWDKKARNKDADKDQNIDKYASEDQNIVKYVNKDQNIDKYADEDQNKDKMRWWKLGSRRRWRRGWSQQRT